VLYLMSAMDLCAAFAAILVLKPLIRRHHAKNEAALAYETKTVVRKSVGAES